MQITGNLKDKPFLKGTFNLLSLLDSGATQIFKKLDIGSLDIGDYLGNIIFFVSLVS